MAQNSADAGPIDAIVSVCRPNSIGYRKSTMQFCGAHAPSPNEMDLEFMPDFGDGVDRRLVPGGDRG